MNSRSSYIGLLLAVMLTIAWASSWPVSAQEPKAPPATGISGVQTSVGDAQKAAAQPRRYQIRKGDVLHVTVFQEPDLETTSRVNENGALTCPLIGAVKLAGITTDEAVTAIETAYRAGYLVKPQVTVLVVQHSAQTITVLGQVLRPGAYELPPDGATNILQALGMAGGCTRLANPSRVTLKRQGPNGQELHKLDIKSMASGNDTTLFEVHEGDVITVPEKLF